MEKILIGTSGYDYPEWKGVFYPTDLRRSDFLEYYSRQFNALELNNTFYNMPSSDRIASFVERSGERLSFSVKANRMLTHEVSSLWQTVAQDFRSSLYPMQEKGLLSAVLFQLPQGFRYTEANRFYLAHLISAFEGFPVFIEFRHVEWIRESVLEGIRQRGASVVFCDMPQLKSLPNGLLLEEKKASLGTDFVGDAYVRLHGRNDSAWYVHDPSANGSQRYDYEYSDGELAQFVPVVHTALEEGRKVQMYFNNHPKGNGAKNALKMKDLVHSI